MTYSRRIRLAPIWVAIALALAIVLLAFAVVPAFAIMDPNVPADECSGNSAGGAAFGKGVGTGGASGVGAPVHDTNVPGENDGKKGAVCPGQGP